MRILLISPVGEPAHTRRIPAALAQHSGVDVTVIAPELVATDPVYHPSGWFTIAGEEHVDGFRLVPVALRDPTNFRIGFDAKRLRGLIINTQPDVIQVWGGPTAPYLLQVLWLKLRDWPNAKVVFYGFDNLPIRLRLRDAVKFRVAWRAVDGGIEATSEGVENLRKAGFRGPVERISWGICTDEYRVIERHGLRERLGFGQEKLVGYVGRFVPEKGLRVLIAALQQMPTEVHGVLIGEGPMRVELELLEASPGLQGRVNILGPMPPEKLVKYMNCFDALALPSLTTPHWKEQYGRVIGEAMACGVVVVGSNSGSIPEVIGGAGAIVAEGDAAALAKALERAVFNENVRGRLIPAGIRRAREELSVNAMSERLLEFYTRITNQDSRTEHGR